MIELEPIISSVQATMKSFSHHDSYPKNPGLYAISLKSGSSIKEFASPNQVIYVGKAEDSLLKRDFNTHFKDGMTGNSTLRRSIGAILKAELKAKAFSRNGTLIKPNIDNYKFDSKAEVELSQWMKENLLIGYWEYDAASENEPLRAIEVALSIALRPTLDLDRNTRKYNIHATALTKLRQICKDEATQNVVDKIDWY